MKDSHTFGFYKRLAGTLLASALLGATLASAANSVDLQSLVDQAHAKFQGNNEGANANYIPVLDAVDPNLFGLVIVTRDGKTYAAGDVDYKFSIQSVAKPFTAALVMEAQGIDAIRDQIGVEPTGLPFNSIIAIEMNEKRSRNPLVNAGAIAAVSMIDARDAERARWGYPPGNWA